MKLTITKNVILQAVLTAATMLNANISPERVERLCQLLITVAQAGIAIAAHFRRPDGTKESQPAQAPKAV